MKTAKIFKNGQSQAVRLPKEFRLEGDECYVKRVGNAIMLIPKQNSWQPLIDAVKRFSNDFMTERDQPIEQQEREDL